MRHVKPSLLAALCCLSPLSYLCAQVEEKAASIEPKKTTPTEPKAAAKPAAPFEAFTGKITKNKVRLRLQPSFDGAVVRELNRDDLLVIKGQTEDFYSIQPAADMKAYIYRTYVLDNVVEGNKVNVRLKPDLEAPVIAQLNSGDRVEGTVDPTNNKWLQIKMPASSAFYVAKEYVEKIGDADYITRLEKRKEEVNRLLNTTISVSNTEMQKPFDQINIDGITANYKHIMLDYPDFPEVGAKAKNLLTALQESYVQKKIAFLETQAQKSSVLLESKNKQLATELKSQQNKLSQLEKQLKEKQASFETETITAQALPGRKTVTAAYPANMLAWMPTEDALYRLWVQQQPGKTALDDFYRDQGRKAFRLQGVIEPYMRPVNNKPGDYMLVNGGSKLPIAFLYSTKINLQDYVGHQVSVNVSPRANNHFAYPAYYVLDIE